MGLDVALQGEENGGSLGSIGFAPHVVSDHANVISNQQKLKILQFGSAKWYWGSIIA
jgi:hypothetical protein